MQNAERFVLTMDGILGGKELYGQLPIGARWINVFDARNRNFRWARTFNLAGPLYPAYSGDECWFRTKNPIQVPAPGISGTRL